VKKINSFTSFIAGLTFLFLITVLGQASPDVFRWTDEQGRTHFTDDVKKTPKQFRPEAEEKKQKDIPPLVPLEESPETKVDESSSDGFQEGVDAFVRNDYKTAFEKFMALAEQGDAYAQFNVGWMYVQRKWGQIFT
jgi:hypothetical protein